jgi:hypothetical protein
MLQFTEEFHDAMITWRQDKNGAENWLINDLRKIFKRRVAQLPDEGADCSDISELPELAPAALKRLQPSHFVSGGFVSQYFETAQEDGIFLFGLMCGYEFPYAPLEPYKQAFNSQRKRGRGLPRSSGGGGGGASRGGGGSGGDLARGDRARRSSSQPSQPSQPSGSASRQALRPDGVGSSDAAASSSSSSAARKSRATPSTSAGALRKRPREEGGKERSSPRPSVMMDSEEEEEESDHGEIVD